MSNKTYVSVKKEKYQYFWLKKVPFLELILMSSHKIYSQTSIARTPMARLPWLIRTRF